MGRPDNSQARIAILVLGMHRSGTSALARLIGHLGAGLPADAIEAHADNARGYWESAAIVKAGDQLLRVARSSWFDPRPLDLLVEWAEQQRALWIDRLGALDILAATVSMWSGARKALAVSRPEFAQLLARIEGEPRVAAVWARHWPR